MSNFLIFKAAFNGSATPAIGTYTAEGATAQFNRNTSISPDYYLYNTTYGSAVQWFVPTTETTDFEFVADICPREFSGYLTYFIIADSTGTTRLRMWSVNNWVHFECDGSTSTTGSAHIGTINGSTYGGAGKFHRFRIRVRKLTASTSSVEVYVDGSLLVTATADAALVTCAKISFMGNAGETVAPGINAGVQNVYLYDLSGGDVIDRGVLSEAFNRFINWMKTKFALKSDIPTVNDATLTIQQNSTNVQTFTANQATAATANIQCVDLSTAQTVAGNKTFSGNTKFAASATIEKSGGDVELLIKNTAIDVTNVSTNAIDDIRFVDSNDKITGAIRISYDTSNGVTAMMYARSYSADGSVSATNGISIMSNQQTGAARASVSANLLPNSTDTYDLGSSAAQWNNAYIKSLTINGVACGDILTHNASEFVPVTGGAVLSNDSFGRTVNDSELSINGGKFWGQGASVSLRGKDKTSDAGSVLIYVIDNNTDKYMQLYPNGTWTWSGTACVIGSDRRIKDEIESIPDEILDAWENLEPKQYKLKSDLETDKDNAQVHYGWIAQDVESVIKGDRKAEIKNGLWLHETWDEQEEISHEETYTEEVETKSGEKQTVTKTRKVIDQPYKAKGDSYGLRYTECLVVECKYLRRCIERLTARIEELEKGKEQEATK